MSYTLYISSLSPYSSKAAALLGFAGVSCRVRHENIVNRYAVLERLTGDTMVPVLRRGAWAINDSTRIARWADRQSDRRLVPERSGLAALAWLLEEFADEWVGRWMVFSRWNHEADARRASRIIGEEMAAGLPLVDRPLGEISSRLIRRQLRRGGARERNRRALEQSRDRTLQALETYFESTDGFLFGGSPNVADFGLYGPIEQYRRDPTGSDRTEMYPAIAEWLDVLDRMRVPHPVVATRHGVDRDLEALRPLFGEFFGTYWRVAVGVHRARNSEGETPDPVEIELLDGSTFATAPSGYLAGRVEFVLRVLEQLVETGSADLFRERLEIAGAIDRALERLASYRAGERLLREFEGLAERV